MTREEREQRSKERYRRLKQLRPDLWKRAVEIGSLVTCSGTTDLQRLAAVVESAVVSEFLSMVDSESA